MSQAGRLSGPSSGSEESAGQDETEIDPRGTAALVLAGGGSSRLGEPKQLLDWGGRSLLEHVLEQVRGLPVEGVFVVLGAHSEKIMARTDLTGVTVVENFAWQEGMASSLRAGLDTLWADPRWKRVLIILADQPCLSAEVVRRLLEAHHRSGKPAVVPRYRYAPGHPVLTARDLWPRLLTGLHGDQGARKMFATHPEWVEQVRVDQVPPRDIDTTDDWEQVRPRSFYLPTREQPGTRPGC